MPIILSYTVSKLVQFLRHSVVPLALLYHALSLFTHTLAILVGYDL